MTPGTYLRKRREAAGLDIGALALRLATLPEAWRRPTVAELARLGLNIQQSEGGLRLMSLRHAALLAKVIRLDLYVYEQLLVRHAAGPFAAGYPEPQVCRGCACSWNDPCHVRADPDSWADPCSWVVGDPTLCTRCESELSAADVARLAAERAATAPLPELVR